MAVNIMSMAECVAAIQTNSPQIHDGNPVDAWYLVIAMSVIVVGFVVLIFFHASRRRTSKR
jgi:hypothetical protein